MCQSESFILWWDHITFGLVPLTAPLWQIESELTRPIQSHTGPYVANVGCLVSFLCANICLKPTVCRCKPKTNLKFYVFYTFFSSLICLLSWFWLQRFFSFSKTHGKMQRYFKSHTFRVNTSNLCEKCGNNVQNWIDNNEQWQCHNTDNATKYCFARLEDKLKAYPMLEY